MVSTVVEKEEEDGVIPYMNIWMYVFLTKLLLSQIFFYQKFSHQE